MLGQGQSEEDWDDELIMKIFHDSVKRHRTANNSSVDTDEKLAAPLPQIPSHSSTRQPSNKRQKKEVNVSKKVSFEPSSSSSSMKSAIEAYAQSVTRQALLSSSEQKNSSKEALGYETNASEHFNEREIPAVSDAIIDDALQSMLMAWYHSGYATGRYQTLCELRRENGEWNSNGGTNDSFNNSV